MGDVVNSMKRALRNGKAWTLVLAAATIWSGSVAATPESVAQSSEPVPPAAAPASLPATISRLAVMEGAPGTRIELVADSALVWTTYRDADGALVIELPNTRPLESVHAANPPAGLVSSVAVAVDETSDRPLTRLTVRTRQEAEHTLVAGPNSLHIDLNPAGVARVPTAFETVAAADVPPAAETAAPAPAAAPTVPAAPVASLAALGTPDRPYVAPPPTGPLGSLLGSVEVVEEGASTVVRIAGNGEFAYSTFQLANPDRFVIDLDGVVNQSARSSAPLDGEILARIRVSQFRKSPEAVSRVVFDLRQTVPPTIERGPEGLVVRFGAAAPAAAGSTLAAVQPQPEPAVEPVAPGPVVARPAAAPQVPVGRPLPASGSRRQRPPGLARPRGPPLTPSPRRVRGRLHLVSRPSRGIARPAAAVSRDVAHGDAPRVRERAAGRQPRIGFCMRRPGATPGHPWTSTGTHSRPP